MIDNVFKIGLLVIGIAFLVLFFQYASNGRYQQYENRDEDVGPSAFDTRTGKYLLHPVDSATSEGERVELDSVNKTVAFRPAQKPK
jgi:hypothetical protein